MFTMNKNISRNCYLVGFILLLVLSLGCASPPVSETTFGPSTSDPIIVDPDSTYSISVANFDSELVPGSKMGHHHDGIFKVRQTAYWAQGQVSEEFEDAYQSGVEYQLRTAGYSIPGSSSGSVFGEGADESWKARFLVGGTITKAKLDTYAPMAGNKSVAEVTVRWEVLDRELNEVVYNKEFPGSAVSPGVTNDCSRGAVSSSFREVLADREFYMLLKTDTQLAQVRNTTSNIEITKLTGSTTAMTTEDLVGQAIPSVVTVKSENGHATGFIISSDGYVLTNYHAVKNAAILTVDLYDGSSMKARIVAVSSESDLALLEIESKQGQLKALPLCFLADVKVGAEVVAIGSPIAEALSHSVTKGIVSGIRRLNDHPMIQTDVAVNPGSSGGPLLNRYGAAIGIITAKLSATGIEGLGFAIPLDEAITALGISYRVE